MKTNVIVGRLRRFGTSVNIFESDKIFFTKFTSNMPSSQRKKTASTRTRKSYRRRSKMTKRRSSHSYRGGSLNLDQGWRWRPPSIHVFLTNNDDWKLSELLTDHVDKLKHHDTFVVESVASLTDPVRFYTVIANRNLHSLHEGVLFMIADTSDRLGLTKELDGTITSIRTILNDETLSKKLPAGELQGVRGIRHVYTILLRLQFLTKFHGKLIGAEPSDYDATRIKPDQPYDAAKRQNSILDTLTTSKGPVFMTASRLHGTHLIQNLADYCKLHPDVTCHIYDIAVDEAPNKDISPFNIWKSLNQDIIEDCKKHLTFKRVLLTGSQAEIEEKFIRTLNPLSPLRKLDHQFLTRHYTPVQ